MLRINSFPSRFYSISFNLNRFRKRQGQIEILIGIFNASKLVGGLVHLVDGFLWEVVVLRVALGAGDLQGFDVEELHEVQWCGFFGALGLDCLGLVKVFLFVCGFKRLGFVNVVVFLD